MNSRQRRSPTEGTESFPRRAAQAIATDDVGFHGRPRVREGASQAEVAELAAVSLNWYELFESGRGDRRVSVDFIQRIAKALRLEFDDRIELYRLALPEAQVLDDLQQRTENAASSVLRAIPELLERVINASHLDDILTVAADSVNAALYPDYATIVTIVNEGSLLGFATGPQAEKVGNSVHRMFWDLHRDLPKEHLAIMGSISDNDEFLNVEHSVQVIAVAGENRNVFKSWRWTPQQLAKPDLEWPAGSSLALPIHKGDVLRALLGALWTAPRKFSRIELETVRAIAAIVDLFSKRIS